jgi:hypothetical protein
LILTGSIILGSDRFRLGIEEEEDDGDEDDVPIICLFRFKEKADASCDDRCLRARGLLDVELQGAAGVLVVVVVVVLFVLEVRMS